MQCLVFCLLDVTDYEDAVKLSQMERNVCLYFSHLVSSTEFFFTCSSWRWEHVTRGWLLHLKILMSSFSFHPFYCCCHEGVAKIEEDVIYSVQHPLTLVSQGNRLDALSFEETQTWNSNKRTVIFLNVECEDVLLSKCLSLLSLYVEEQDSCIQLCVLNHLLREASEAVSWEFFEAKRVTRFR